MNAKNKVHETKETLNCFKEFSIGSFKFRRDIHYVHIYWPDGYHVMPVDNFLRAMMRDISWNFFYGVVNFDPVFGTMNHYDSVELYAGKYNTIYQYKKAVFSEKYETKVVLDFFISMLNDWSAPGFDSIVAPDETGTSSGFSTWSQQLDMVSTKKRTITKRMVGLPNDAPLRADETGHRINRAFSDVDQSEPMIDAEPGCEDKLHAFNLFAYLSRSDSTWNPSICSVVNESLYCPTTEEGVLPIIHGNDRVEWFIQLSDTIYWDIQDKETGEPQAQIVMHPGDVAAMPANIRHQGYAPKRSMLLVWENASPLIPTMLKENKIKPYPVEF